MVLIEVDSTGDVNMGSYLSPGFTWSVNIMGRAGVHKVVQLFFVHSVYTVEVGSLHALRLESLKLVFQPQMSC
jgi:hypothetical protein